MMALLDLHQQGGLVALDQTAATPEHRELVTLDIDLNHCDVAELQRVECGGLDHDLPLRQSAVGRNLE